MSEHMTLVGVDELARNPQWRVFDCQHDLGNPALGEQQYREGHIPHALHAHLDRDLSSPSNGGNGRHPLPSAGAFAAWLERQGVQNRDQIVAYDASGGMYAARLWWLLRWVGHRAVAVLDGGLPRWIAAGHAVSTEQPQFPATTYEAAPDSRAQVGVQDVLANLTTHTSVLIDARSPERYQGIGETLDRVGGHIPGARNRYYMDNLQADGLFKPAEQLRSEFAAVLQDTPAGAVIAQCGSGVTACHNLLAMEIAGLRGARLYPGSWSEWCADPERPVER